MDLSNKKILLGICGGIAAYKSAELVRRLKDRGADVRVVMTKSACEFITPLTLQALSGNAVATELLNPAAEAGMSHIELAKWADLIIIAPATANVIAKLTIGLADDLLSTLCIASPSLIAICPAMNQQMYQHQALQSNLAILAKRNIRILGPAAGSQACGDVGMGRMLEANDIVNRVAELFYPPLLAGKTVIITAGPTQEAIDPVRYISNHSSGKMGFALASAAAQFGARVILVAGPVALTTPVGVQRVDVTSAQEMLAAVLEKLNNSDIFIGCAAVADYRPNTVAINKIKKSTDELQLNLTKNPDILATVAAQSPQIFTVGFAAETDNLTEYAQDKLLRKKVDMIAANNVANSEIGFNSENNALEVFWGKEQISLPKTDKRTLALQLLKLIADKMVKS